MKIDKQIVSYFSVLGFILLLIIISARHVLFVPWTGRTWISIVGEKGKLFIPGGMDMHNQMSDRIFLLDLENNSLKKAGTLPSPRYSTASVFVAPYLYVIGGYDKDGYLNQVVRFDPEEKKSEVVMNLSEPRCYGSAVIVNGAIYYIGGFDGSQAVDTILKIDVNSKTVTTTGHLPDPVNFQGCAVDGNSVYIVGGENGKGEDINDILEIDPVSGKVLRRGTLPHPVIRTGVSILKNSLYVMGGWGEGGKRDDIFRVDLTSDNLHSEAVGMLDKKASDIPLYTWNGKLYLIGGIESRYGRQLNVVQYDPVTKKQENLKLKSYSWWE